MGSSGPTRPPTSETTGPPAADLDSRDAVAELVRRFYAAAAQDDLIGPFFNEVAKVDWSEHLPRLTAFWSRVLLGIHGPDPYTGNPLQAHLEIHRQRPFAEAHFHRWLELFNETVDEGWHGPVAEKAKHLAANVARVHSQQLTGCPVSLPE